MAMAGKDKVLQSLTDQLQESEEQKARRRIVLSKHCYVILHRSCITSS